VPVFELIERVARTGDVAVLRAEIHGDQRAVCASLVLGRGAMDVALPCHSADAMALAVRAQGPDAPLDKSRTYRGGFLCPAPS